jgi:hypothetical protein
VVNVVAACKMMLCMKICLWCGQVYVEGCNHDAHRKVGVRIQVKGEVKLLLILESQPIRAYCD